MPRAADRQNISDSSIRLIAIDLDGTLLTDEKKVCSKAAESLKCLPAEIRVVIASARPPRAVRQIYRELGLSTWQINYNGAVIWDEINSRAVFHRPIAGALVREMIEMSRDMFDEILITCEIMDRWHTDRADNSFTTETGKMFKPDVVAPYETFCEQPITKLMLLGEPQMLNKLEPMLLERFGKSVTIVQTDDHLLQIMHHNVSKAVALKKVAEHYGVSRDEILAIGDAPNDVGMLQYAGVSIAMDNAKSVVKEVADWIAPSNNDHGVHAALVRYGICKI